ncbi:MAG TPA: hypothetical protein VGD68_07260 [Streptosporangiaceae bacterium]
MGHRGAEGSGTPEEWPGQQYVAAPRDEGGGFGATAYASRDDSSPGPRGPARGFPPAPDQPKPVYPQGDFGSWNDTPDDQAGPHSQPGPADPESRQWGEGSGQWDAPYGQWDESGHFHQGGQGGRAGGTGAQPVPAWVNSGHPGNSGYDERRRDAGQDLDPRDFAAGDFGGRGSFDGDGPVYGDEIDGDEIDGGRESGPRRRGPDGRSSRGSDGRSSRGSDGRSSRGGGTRARETKMKVILLTGAGAVVVAALAATAYTFLTGKSGHNATTGAGVTAPKLPSPTAPATAAGSKYGKWGFITSRATDQPLLTVNELYPAQFEINNSSFQRTTDRADTNCNSALFGTALQKAAKAYGCTQVVRASYVSSDQSMMGTIGVVNLSTANDAAKAGSASGSTDFVTPLNSKSGPTKNLSQGTGVVQAEFKGHYLILIWAEYSNLKAPTTDAQRTQLEQFSSNLISGSANIALSNRMVNGHPQAAGSAAGPAGG